MFTNAQTISELSVAQDKFVRSTLEAMLDHCGADQLIGMLAEVIDDYAHKIATREGAYARAAALGVMVEHLESLDKFIDNYEPRR